MVVRGPLLRMFPRSPTARMSPCTVHLAIRSPRRLSSACILRTPTIGLVTAPCSRSSGTDRSLDAASLRHMTVHTPASWHPDPFGRHELRYWDGGQWTQHVASRGRQEIDPPMAGSPVPTVNRASRKAQRDVRRAGAAGAQVGGGTLFTEPVLVVNQKAKLVELNAEYAVYDQHGQKIGAVREVGQSIMKKAIAVRPAQNRTHRLQIVDMNGRVHLALTRPANIVRSKVIVRDASGAEIGQIVQKNIGMIGKIRFVLETDGRQLGSINAEGWDDWDFNIQDATENEIARITRTWAGLAKEMFTKSDNYVVQINRSLDEPLRSLVIAAALAVDTALSQGAGARVWRR